MSDPIENLRLHLQELGNEMSKARLSEMEAFTLSEMHNANVITLYGLHYSKESAEAMVMLARATQRHTQVLEIQNKHLATMAEAALLLANIVKEATK